MKIVYEGPTWNSARPYVKEKFDEAGLLYVCEVNYGKCDLLHLTFAHSKRRRYIENKEEMEEVVRACQKCHAILDAKKHPVTYEEVLTIINNRITPVRSIYEKPSADSTGLQGIPGYDGDTTTHEKRVRLNKAPRKRLLRRTRGRSSKNILVGHPNDSGE